jgi:hypothetical protein
MKTKPDFIMPFSDTSAGLSQVGGKSTALLRLVWADLPMPGFEKG